MTRFVPGRTLRTWRKQPMNVIENVTRKLAYDLWDHAGRPNCRSDEFWFAARFEFERREETGEIQVYPQSPFYEHDVVVRDGTGRAVRMTGATRRTGKRIGIDA